MSDQVDINEKLASRLQECMRSKQYPDISDPGIFPKVLHCKDCEEYFGLENFYNNRSSYCKNCHNKRCREYYHKNKKKFKERTARSRQRYFKYLCDQVCADCGIDDPIVLTHDHIDPSTKYKKVSAMIGKNSWKRIEQEIAKCQVVCANCHARRTAKSQGWYDL